MNAVCVAQKSFFIATQTAKDQEEAHKKEKNMNTYYNKTKEEIEEIFGSCDDGLSQEQVTSNREQFGENILYEKKKKSKLQIFAEQFKDLLVIILIIAAIISAVTGNIESMAVIIAVLILNAILGTVQTIKAEKSLDSLKKLSSPEAKVIRDGQQMMIDAADLVCGDIIVLDAGDVIPGDARIIENHSLKTNESALTGESESSEKTDELVTAGKPDNAASGTKAVEDSGESGEDKVALGDQNNMVFSGTLVTYGRARAIVTAVGKDTELGRIAGLLDQTSERKTPLQITMDNFSKKLSIGIIAICAVVFGLSIYRGMATPDALLFAVALAVAAIPEALSSIITISLAIGTKRMADENAIIKQLEAVEGLGCVSIICSDKTGTLTQNRMTVEYVSPWKGQDQDLMLASILCNDTAVLENEEGSSTVGDPTETALVEFYARAGWDTVSGSTGELPGTSVDVADREMHFDDYYKLIDDLPRMGEVPFDSDRKLMSTFHEIDGMSVMYTKGALDVILSRTANLTEEEKKAIADENLALSNQGLRVLAFAKKSVAEAVSQSSTSENASDSSLISTDDEYDLEYVGLMAEMDPPRVESAQAVEDCLKAGIKPIMITGDHKITASAIARRIGIMKEGDLAFTGPEIDAMSDEELNDKLERISVYARVSPDNKIRIVNRWQERDCIVAMTGDGVNDGPALKSADVGVAMGITGTDVAKDAASMILTDDNFATIIKSVLNGRNIYANIKNAIKFLLSGNTAGILAVLYASLAALPMPFTAVQLLFINLITDSLPALAISMEPSNPDLINDRPRPRNESVLNRPTMTDIIVTGVLIAICTIGAFYIGLNTGSSVTASTMAFATLCLARLWHGFNCRGRASIFRLGLLTNKFTIGAFVVGALLLHMLLLVPALAHLFNVSMLDPDLLMYVWGLAFLPTLIIQIVKIIRK